jgi:hypothetical protein
MKLADVIRRMMAAGATAEAIIGAVEAFETTRKKKPKSAGAIRQARYRERCANAEAVTTRTAALRVWCPLCLAKPGEACGGKRGPRRAVHRDRLFQAAQP